MSCIQFLNSAQKIGDITVISAVVENSSADEIRSMAESIKAENTSAVAVLAASGEKITFCAAAGKDAIAKGVHAGNIIREVTKAAGGSGGGKPDMAQGGGKERDKVDAAIAMVEGIVADQTK